MVEIALGGDGVVALTKFMFLLTINVFLVVCMKVLIDVIR